MRPDGLGEPAGRRLHRLRRGLRDPRAIAVSKGYISGEPTLSTVAGVIILGVAFLVSFAVTTRMKDRDVARKKREKIEEQWREYYARVYPQFYRQR